MELVRSISNSGCFPLKGFDCFLKAFRRQEWNPKFQEQFKKQVTLSERHFAGIGLNEIPFWPYLNCIVRLLSLNRFRFFFFTWFLPLRKFVFLFFFFLIKNDVPVKWIKREIPWNQEVVNYILLVLRFVNKPIFRFWEVTWRMRCHHKCCPRLWNKDKRVLF